MLKSATCCYIMISCVGIYYAMEFSSMAYFDRAGQMAEKGDGNLKLSRVGRLWQ